MSNQPLVDKRMFLGAIPLFESLNQEDLEQLLQQTREKHFAANKVIMAQGEPGEDMFIITRGTVRVSLHLADGEDVTVGKLKAGDAFGEIALFDQQSRTATVTTCEATEFLNINRDGFQHYLIQHPHVAIQLLGTLSKRLRATSDLLKDTVYSNVNHRLAETLAKIAQAYGKQTRDGLQVDISFDDQELARIAGIPAEVATAQLHHWCEAGIISRNHQTLTVIKPDELEAIK